MVLSYALAKRSGRDFETLLRERLLSPLGMDDTFIVRRLFAVRVAEGHFSNSRRTGSRDVRVDLAGAGGQLRQGSDRSEMERRSRPQRVARIYGYILS